MKFHRRGAGTLLLAGLALAGGLGAPMASHAQEWAPSKPVRIIVPIVGPGRCGDPNRRVGWFRRGGYEIDSPADIRYPPREPDFPQVSGSPGATTRAELRPLTRAGSPGDCVPAAADGAVEYNHLEEAMT